MIRTELDVLQTQASVVTELSHGVVDCTNLQKVLEIRHRLKTICQVIKKRK